MSRRQQQRTRLPIEPTPILRRHYGHRRETTAIQEAVIFWRGVMQPIAGHAA